MARIDRGSRKMDWRLYGPDGEIVAVFRYLRGARHVARLLGWTVAIERPTWHPQMTPAQFQAQALAQA